MKEILAKIEKGYANKRRGLPYTRYVSLNLGKPFSVFFYKLGVRPNWITFFSFLLALVAVLALMGLGSGIKAGLLLLVLLQLSYALDCSDGQVARLQGSSSPQGAWFDLLMDRVTGFMLITGVLYWFWLQQLFSDWASFFTVFIVCLFANTFFSYASNLKGLLLPASSAGQTDKPGNWLKELLFTPSDTGVFYLVLALTVCLPSWRLLFYYSCYKIIMLVLVMGSTLSGSKTKVGVNKSEEKHSA